MDLFPVVTGSQTFMETGHFAPHASKDKTLAMLPNDARVLTFWSGITSMRIANVTFNTGGPQTIVVPPGQTVTIYASNGGSWMICGFLLPKEPKILEAALATKEAALRADFEKSLAETKADFDAKLAAIQDALKNAAVEALRSASTQVLVREATSGVVDAIPEKLATAIRAQVDAAVASALGNMGHG